jgi:hypothetical protein
MKKESVGSEFVARLAPALRQAASIASTLEGRVANRPKSDEATAVKAAMTIADSASQEALLVPLYEHFPHVCLAAEEDTPSVGRFAAQGEALVVIDPIDGTLRFYLEAMGPYAIMMGLAVAGEYEAALVALPREGLFFTAVRGAGATVSRGDGIPRQARFDPDGDRILVNHDLPDESVIFLKDKGFEVVPASGGAISVAPVVPGVRAGLRLVRTVPQVSIRGRIGALVSAEAGALVRSELGGEFPRQIEAPARALLLATGEGDMAVLEEALAIAERSLR